MKRTLSGITGAALVIGSMAGVATTPMAERPLDYEKLNRIERSGAGFLQFAAWRSRKPRGHFRKPSMRRSLPGHSKQKKHR